LGTGGFYENPGDGGVLGLCHDFGLRNNHTRNVSEHCHYQHAARPHCDLVRVGEHVATLDRTPGTVKVDKTKNDIMLTCTMPGYQDASVNLESGYGAGTFGNIILGGAIGWGIDSATGADNKYPSSAVVQFIPAATTPNTAPPLSTADNSPAIRLEPAAATAVAGPAPHPCTHDEQVQARIAKENGYTAGPRCD
jgi:hypothetical protein